MLYTIVGSLYKVFPEQQITERFRKREFVLTVQDGMYVEYVKFVLTQDRCGLIDSYSIGSVLKVTFAITGREVQGRDGGEPIYFTNLNALKIEPHSSEMTSSSSSDEHSFDTYDDVPF